VVDNIDRCRRSVNMSKIKSRDTGPEIRLRRMLHRMGLRFRVCLKDLPGKPDIVFSRQRLAVQVRGCFWHQHENCRSGRLPASNLDYWKPKLERNVIRDMKNDEMLAAMGWRVIVIWECEIKNVEGVIMIANKIFREVRGD
jgi:DNA mismatch endonuclease, patch repair protein